MEAEEQRLVQAGQAGDIEAFNQLVHVYEGRVYNLCLRMLGDGDAAADAAQDTFIAAFRHLRRFRGGSFRSWILRIATNTCYDVLRARKRHPTSSLDIAFDLHEQTPPFAEPADPGEAPDDVVVRHELGAAIQQGLDLLPEEQRIVVILCDVQGMPYDEIATITSTNLGTVKSRLSRGRARMRDFLKERELLPSQYRHAKE